ncbi:MAG: nucleotidyltransferase domain-containing protein [Candidatus Aenigmarchaeota archaeon]|nr:nucleotidyltransferase domain-containing protein [Candidatus Aenigmarchaeota archaeon]
MLRKTNTQKVMEMFFDFPTTTFTVREIARRLKISPPGSSSAVKTLEKEGLLTRKKGEAIDQVRANADTRNFVLRKRLYNIERLQSLGLTERLQESNPKAVILFGSYSRGEDTERSDIDIAVIGKAPVGLERFEKQLNRTINIHEIDLRKTSKELKNSLANGIVLEGYLELL